VHDVSQLASEDLAGRGSRLVPVSNHHYGIGPKHGYLAFFADNSRAAVVKDGDRMARDRETTKAA
jgi:hypothetical protein